MKRALIVLLAFVVVGPAFGQSPQPAKVRITTWSLEWFPNGSPREADAGKTSATQDLRVHPPAGPFTRFFQGLVK